MSRRVKKRTKKYQGEDAAVQPPHIVHRYTAVQRSKSGEWWHENKRRVKVFSIVGGVGAVIIWLITEGLKVIFW